MQLLPDIIVHCLKHLRLSVLRHCPQLIQVIFKHFIIYPSQLKYNE